MNQFKLSSFLKDFIKTNRGLCVFLVFMMLGASVSSIFPSYALKYFLDGCLNPIIKGEGNYDASQIALASSLYFGSYLLIAIFTVLQNYLIDLFGEKLIHALRKLMIEKSHKLRPSFFSLNTTGSIVSRVSDDVSAIEMLFAEGLVSLLVNLLKIVGALISLFVFDWVLGLAILVILPFLFLLTESFRKKMLHNQMEDRKALNAESGHLSESLNNFLSIKNFGIEGKEDEAYSSLLHRGYKANERTAFFDSVYSPIIEMTKTLLIGGLALLVSYASSSSSSWLFGLSVGTFAASISLVSGLFSPISNVGQELQSMQQGSSGIKRVESFLSEPEILEKEAAFTAEFVLNHHSDYLLEAIDVDFHYDDGDKLIYSDLDLKIKPEEKIALLGRTGAGKTTLFRLFLGLNEPSTGHILYNGLDVTKIPETSKRALFGYVAQGYEEVPGTVFDQISLGDSSITLDMAKKSLQEVGLAAYIETEIPNSYNALFKRSLFSEGQLQLLALARALVKDPPLLLLDEIDANLDLKTEKALLSALTLASSKRAVLSISHHLNEALGFKKTITIGGGDAISHKLS